MNKLICKQCKTELTVDNIKDVELKLNLNEAFVKCKVCDSLTKVSVDDAFILRDDLQQHKVYSFSDLDCLLENLSEEDKEKVRLCTFKMYEQYPDDDSGDVYDYMCGSFEWL